MGKLSETEKIIWLIRIPSGDSGERQGDKMEVYDRFREEHNSKTLSQAIM